MLTGMFDRDSLIKRALETGWPFVAGLMAELRGALSAPGEGAVPLELEVSWTPPAPRASAMDSTGPVMDTLRTSQTGPARQAPARKLAMLDTLRLYFPPLEPLETPPARYGPRPSIWMLGMPRAPEPEGPPETLDPAPLLARLERLTTSCADPAAEARRMALWQARRRAELQAGKRGRMHPLRMGRPPGYVKDRLRRDTLQRKLWDFWQFCHWADTATDPPARPAGAGLAPA